MWWTFAHQELAFAFQCLVGIVGTRMSDDYTSLSSHTKQIDLVIKVVIPVVTNEEHFTTDCYKLVLEKLYRIE